MLKIKVTTVGPGKKLSGLQDVLKNDLGKAVHETAEALAMDIRRGIGSSYGTRDADVRGSMRVSKASAGKLTAQISIWGSPRKKGRALNLIRFLQQQSTAGTLRRSGMFGTSTRAEEKKRQTHAEMIKQQQLKFLIKRGVISEVEGAFIANGGRTVFKRVGKDRLPIEPVQTIGHGQMFSSHAIRDPALAKAKTLLEARILKLLKNA